MTVEERESYLFARVEGRAPPEGQTAAECLEEIADHCFRYRCSAVLIEKYLPEPFPVWETFAVATKLADIGPPQVKIAVVEKIAPPPPEEKLTISIGRERRLDVHVFTDISEAEQWLLRN